MLNNKRKNIITEILNDESFIALFITLLLVFLILGYLIYTNTFMTLQKFIPVDND